MLQKSKECSELERGNKSSILLLFLGSVIHLYRIHVKKTFIYIGYKK